MSETIFDNPYFILDLELFQ